MTIRETWNEAKLGCPDAVLILEADGAYHTFGDDAEAIRYAMGFDEAKHPRDPEGTSEGGRFAAGEGEATQGDKQAPEASTQDQTQTEAFREWFGESKVVDDEGKPLRVFHGTGRDFEYFATHPRTEIGSRGRVRLAGAWFASDPDDASGYATSKGKSGSPKVLPVYLKIENPHIESIDDFSEYKTKVLGLTPERIEELKSQGHDGVVIHANWGQGTPYGLTKRFLEVVAFEPTQIKSATGNQGTFDPEDLRINYAKRFTAHQLNAALEELTSRGTQVVFAQQNAKDTVAEVSRVMGEIDAVVESARDAFAANIAKRNTVAMDTLIATSQKYAADPWSPFTGPRGGKGWKNSQTGRVFYGPNKPGRDEPGEEVMEPPTAGEQAAPPVITAPPEPTMENPIPLPPGTATGLGATGASGLPNFQDPTDAEGEQAAPQWGDTTSIASLYGRDNMSPQNAARFNMSAAKAMGLEIPKGDPEQQAELANEFLRHNATQLAETMNAAESMGWKPRGKKLITNAGSAARWMVAKAESQGYARQGGDMADELAGAVNHLQDSEQAIQAAPGLSEAVAAYKQMAKLVGPLLGIPLALAYGYSQRGKPATVAEANTHLDKLADRLGLRSPFAPTTTVDPTEKAKPGFDPSGVIRTEGTGEGFPSDIREPKKTRTTRMSDSKFTEKAATMAQEADEAARAQGWTPQTTAPTAEESVLARETAKADTAAQKAATSKANAEARKAESAENEKSYHEAVNQIPMEHRREFMDQVAAMHEDHVATQNAVINQRRELIESVAGKGNTGTFTRDIQRAGDANQVPKFDELVQIASNSTAYGNLMDVSWPGLSSGTDEEGGTEQRLFEILQKPAEYHLPKPIHEVASDTADEWQRQEAGAQEQADDVSFDPSEFDGFGAEEFAKRGQPQRYSVTIGETVEKEDGEYIAVSTMRTVTEDQSAQKFARALASGHLPDLSIPLPSPDEQIAEADRILARHPEELAL